MPLEDATPLPAAPATRRTILRTGVKLAYAAPVVAATMTLSAQPGAAAVSGPVTTGVLKFCICAGSTPSRDVCAPDCATNVTALCQAACAPDSGFDSGCITPEPRPCTL